MLAESVRNSFKSSYKPLLSLLKFNSQKASMKMKSISCFPHSSTQLIMNFHTANVFPMLETTFVKTVLCSVFFPAGLKMSLRLTGDCLDVFCICRIVCSSCGPSLSPVVIISPQYIVFRSIPWSPIPSDVIVTFFCMSSLRLSFSKDCCPL